MTKSPLLALIFVVCAATACSRAVSTAAAAQPVRQPLDPLTAAERATAEKLVRSDQRARELLGDGATLVSVEFLAVKGLKDEVMRHADLLFSRPDTEFGRASDRPAHSDAFDRGVHAHRPQERPDDRG